MKRIGKIIGTILLVLFCGLELFGLIIGLILNTKETISWLVVVAIIGIVIFVLIKLHNKLMSKNKIEWDKYRELNGICGWLCFASWFWLGVIIDGIYQDRAINSEQIIFLPLLVFSFWTYFSLIFGKRNTLFLLRSYLISIASLFGLCLITISGRFLEQINDNAIDTIFICSIIALCIKALIISFRPHIVELFKDSKIAYWQIFVIVLLWASTITLFNTDTITFTKETHSEYPALNTSK